LGRWPGHFTGHFPQHFAHDLRQIFSAGLEIKANLLHDRKYEEEKTGRKNERSKDIEAFSLPPE
jgi:hypothetical protein